MIQIRLLQNGDMPAVIELSLLAWEPVFTAWQQILGPKLYPRAIYPDWRASQTGVVESIRLDPKMSSWVAEVEGQVIGFIVYELNETSKVGEVQLLAVHPGSQNHGVGTQLNNFALQKLKEGGMRMAVVGTGGDEGHAPARRSYEKSGYTGLPLMRYYKDLEAGE